MRALRPVLAAAFVVPALLVAQEGGGAGGGARRSAPSVPVASAPMVKAATAAFHADRLARLDTWIEKLVADGKLPGAVVMLVKDGQVAYHKSYGYRDLGTKAPARPDDIYRIASQTKAITSLAVMMLYEEGRFQLDEPIGRYLPTFKEHTVLTKFNAADSSDEAKPTRRKITIRQLLTHTSGLGYQIVSKGPLLKAYNDAGLVGGRVSRFPIPGFPQVTPAPGLAVWADRLAELPLMYQPATKWSYSCSLDLLGRVIEVVSGMEFEAFLKKRIFEPCGMASTWMQVPASEAGRLTDNYGIVAGNVFPLDPAVNSIYLDAPEVPSGGGGLVSSPKDYDRFLRMLLGYGTIDGKFVMSEEAVRVGTSNLLPATVDTKGTYVDGQGHGAGGRATATTYGWGGAAGTLAAIDFDLKLRTGLWTQYMPSEAYPVRDEFLAALDADLAAMRAKMGKKAA